MSVFEIPKETRAVFFDLNGTLLRDGSLHRQAYQQVFQEKGVLVTDETFEKTLANHTNREIIQTILGEGVRDEEVARLTKDKTEYYFAKLHAGIVPVPGALAVLQALHNQDVPCYLVTSAGFQTADETLRLLGLRQYFSALVTSDIVVRGKPYPDVYLAALARAQLQPTQVLAFEDSPQGISAARAAEVPVVAVGGEYEQSQLKDALYIITDFTEVVVA